MGKIRAVHQLELSSHCQNKCVYCPAPIQGKWREVGEMNEEVFERCVYWIKHFMREGTQQEINMFGIGEAFINPNVLKYIEVMLEIYRGREKEVLVGTNGKAMDEDVIKELKRMGVVKLYLTDHHAKDSMKTVQLCQRNGLPVFVNRDFVIAPNNWAGQVDWCDKVDYKYVCGWIGHGRTMVYHDGRITRCCIDAKGAGVIGTIFDNHVNELEHGPFSLCKTCHHEVPKEMAPLGDCHETMGRKAELFAR